MFSVDLSTFKSAVVPVLLVNESAYMDEETLEMLQSKLFDMQEHGRIAGFVLLGFGVAVLIVSLFAVAVYYVVIAPKVRAQNIGVLGGVTPPPLPKPSLEIRPNA